MKICYENNIKLNFFKYVCQYVNQNFKQTLDNETNLTNKQILRKNLNLIKNDLIYNTLKSPIQFHKWINDHKKVCLPTEYKKSYEVDIKHYPYKYSKHMLAMNKYLEDNKLKTFQPICLRSDICNKFITINTNALVDILPNLKNKNILFGQISKDKDFLWANFFNINNLKLKNHSFNHQIQTDGVSVSINFIHNENIEKSNKRKKAMLMASKKGKQLNKNKSRIQIEDGRSNKIEDVINKKIINDEKYKKKEKNYMANLKKCQKKNKIKYDLRKDLNQPNLTI
jgi:hypothetical protein